MTRQLLKPMPAVIVDRQREASDPARSVWVRANAGSGKTYVLTARVLRLLLGGAKPEEILCLTYTKAAAAEMRSRVAGRLGNWAVAGEAELIAELTDLSGAPPTPPMLLRARSLFARALETPGGLRIQTIHAFCESLLHHFPREAGVPFDFAVLEEHERDRMLLEARESVIAAGLRGSAEAAAVETLFGLLSDFQIADAIVEALNKQRTLRRVLAHPMAAKRTLRALVRETLTVEALTEEIVAGYGLSADDHDRIFREASPTRDGSDFAAQLQRIDWTQPDPVAIMDAYLTLERTPRRTLLRKAVADALPDVASRAAAESLRLEQLHRRVVAAELVARSEAFLDIIAAISARYENAKRARSLLDFDDLIQIAGILLKDEGQGSWVRYKLDAGLSHILVDEGQDTNPQQWEVIGALVDDFFFGDSAADRPRTLFAVGDRKQSIFSFQGADPQVFVDAGSQYAFSARAARFEVRHVPLRHSFRTLPNVLAAVDRVFERPDLKKGTLEEGDLEHESARAEGGGLVTLWPPIRDPADESDPTRWAEEPPAVDSRSAQRQVAERMAGEIRRWIDERRPLGPRGRPVRADDVLILVQVRSIYFHEIIRALVRAGIPTPGADRLAVTTHIGVLDLMALGDVLSNPADDLQLAALLRSPLFEVSEDDLFAVAQPRAEDQSLWHAMQDSDVRSVQQAYRQLRAWRGRLDFDRPFDFYAEMLYAGGGLKRMRGRFGSEIDDVVAEFLDLALQHEQSEQPSLLGFLAELRSREVVIKRELAEAGSGVRVMTVHGAKGLEAPIVILADAATTERGRDRRSVYMQAQPPLFFHAGRKEAHTADTTGYREEADAEQLDEYWRKLYVAMTRAEDELYVTGYLTRQGREDGSWYEAIRQALEPVSDTLADGAIQYPAGYVPPSRAVDVDDSRELIPDGPLLLPPLPAPVRRDILRPSTAFSKRTDEARALATVAEEAVDAEAARKEGVALHALLQHLGRVDRSAWQPVALKALGVLLPDAPERHAALAARAASILGRPAFADLFGPCSRAEVPFLFDARRDGSPVTLAGRIDRLVVTPAEVHVVDFKSDARPPDAGRTAPPAYATQLGLYAFVAKELFPAHAVRASILWTSLESLLELPADVLAQAASAFTMR